MWNRICIFISIVVFSPDVYIFYNGPASEAVFQNRLEMATSFGCYCRYSGSASPSPGS